MADAITITITITIAVASKNQCYVGLLYPIEEYKVYGYITHSSIKFLLVLDDTEIKDQDVCSVCQAASSVQQRVLLQIINTNSLWALLLALLLHRCLCKYTTNMCVW
jgi:hypothetical protein